MKSTVISRVTNIDGWILFYILLVMYALYQFAMNNALVTEEFILRSYEDLLPAETLTGLMHFRQRFEWAGYVLVFITIPIKVGYSAICINTGTLLAGYDVRFKRIFKAGLYGEFVFLFATFVQFTWILTVLRPEIIQDLEGFYPLSVLGLLYSESLPVWLHLPLQKLNLFELTYVLVVTGILKEYLRADFRKVLSIVAVSYGFGVLLIIAVAMFFTIQTM